MKLSTRPSKQYTCLATTCTRLCPGRSRQLEQCGTHPFGCRGVGVGDCRQNTLEVAFAAALLPLLQAKPLHLWTSTASASFVYQGRPLTTCSPADPPGLLYLAATCRNRAAAPQRYRYCPCSSPAGESVGQHPGEPRFVPDRSSRLFRPGHQMMTLSTIANASRGTYPPVGSLTLPWPANLQNPCAVIWVGCRAAPAAGKHALAASLPRDVSGLCLRCNAVWVRRFAWHLLNARRPAECLEPGGPLDPAPLP